MINLLNPDGTYNENAGAYAGLDRPRRPQAGRRRPRGAGPAREGRALRDPAQLLRPEQDADRALPVGPVVRPDGRRSAPADAMDAVTSGRVKIHPERYAKSYLDWLGEKRDWCISRQLWWGHRIPIWYCSDDATEADLQRAFGDRPDVAWRRGETRRLADLRRDDLALDEGRRSSRAGTLRRRTPTSSTPGSARPSGRIRRSAGPRRRPSWRSTTRRASSRRPATSSRSGSPGW